MKKNMRKSLPIPLGVFLITLMIISSATVVVSVETSQVVEKLVYDDENIDVKDLLFQTIIEILNDKKLNTFTKNNYVRKTLKFDYTDLEHLYQRGLQIYNRLSTTQIEQQKEKIYGVILTNYEQYTRIVNIIHKNEKILNDIEKLANNNEYCNCDSVNIKNGDPGLVLICLMLFILILALTPVGWVGLILVIITGNTLGGNLFYPMFVVLSVGEYVGCWDSPFPLSNFAGESTTVLQGS